MSFQTVLAIETSCDDTSVAIVRRDGFVVSCLSANQDLAHQPFGGVVPEIASRNHTLQLLPLIEELLRKTKMDWEHIDALAVTSRPGLIGSLLVGVVTAKTLALAKNKPFLGVNHLEAHLLAPFLHDEQSPAPVEFDYPYLALAISGGHTQLYLVQELGKYQVLGRTVDDAAGEAFDKFAKILGLGFPGGVQVDRLSMTGNPKAYVFPRPMKGEDHFHFSFSGLKAAAIRRVEQMSKDEVQMNLKDLCASFQEAVVDSLMDRLMRAESKYHLRKIVLTGGVSANTRLREVASAWAKKNKLSLVIPPIRYCTDNAAMVGYAGLLRLNRGEKSEHDLSPTASSWPNDFIEADTI